MVLPYLKGFINKVKHFYLYSDLISSGYICIFIYFHIRSITSGIRAITSGIIALSWAKQIIFFNFLQEFFGWQVFRSYLYVLVQNLHNLIVDLGCLQKNTEFEKKKNRPNQSPDEQDIVD